MKYKKIVLLSTMSALMVSPFGGQSASAAENEIPSPAGLQIQSGGIHLEVNNVNLNPIMTIDGTPASEFKADVTDVQSLSVKDFTGTKQGWSVYVAATQLTEKAPDGGFKEGTTAMTLPKNVLSLESNLVTTPTFQLENRLSGIDNDIPQKYMSAVSGTGGGINNMPTDGEFKIVARNLSADLNMIDIINYPNTTTQYESTVTFSLVQGTV